ncbi:MAG: hypothetical protein COZ80_10885 [Ignavibacteria bacterium CG_4_8_14_3_um_filter_37_9]|nr:hypothetical protein [Ignavibacteria bacterium]OIO18743.1 MAG: hypothetical protein AUJ54_07415 [Ignavibacteria bacterium CG1_02_37_35]PIQ09426.1 MAG: hypothetical protein COW71_06575 [Ignavibacteriales bacterium CG18_big_fil_WC_8_21_14_2_50_31_20]PIS45235.1 MAG: hypothetical protein COT22_06330 [Ignavibacteria bacterium CG08_land_8_20_14_0_20_37_9]PIW98385.1 MAG: hypothetical protein COZ80_10885 [Ignavibacteria bacterium CG_4_8_14_3_um_filter_37_9]PIX94099.1 MAG: hypothetical protein COZ25
MSIIKTRVPEIFRHLFFSLILFVVPLFAERPDVTLLKIKEHKTLIESAARYFEVNPKYLRAIIYVERTLNYDWEDDALDIPLAEEGFNSSIGFSQVKMKTAYWIEVQVNDSKSSFFPGKKYSGLLKVSKSPAEIIKKLQNDTLNIYFAAAYLRIAQSRWSKANYSIDKKPAIIGTLYSTGLFHADGSERKPKDNPKANSFGKKVLQAYQLFK